MVGEVNRNDHLSIAAVGEQNVRFVAVVFWTIALLITGFTFASLYWPFIAGGEYHYHDSSVPATEIGLFYDRLYGSDSWLWSAALNGGQPLWVSLEIQPFFDPIAFVVYSVAVPLETKWWSPYHVMVFLWMFVFALGGGLCSYQLTQNRWGALLTYVLLLSGPLALAVTSQSHGFLVPFRFFPLSIFFYLRLRQSVTPANALFFTTTIAFGLSGYQSVYVLVLYLGLAISELLVGRKSYLYWLMQLLRPRIAGLFLIPLAASTPLVAWLAYQQDVVSISRTYRHGRAYFVELSHFSSELLNAYVNMIQFDRALTIWHGSTFLGFLVLPFVFLGFRRSALAGITMLWRPAEFAKSVKPIAALWLWLLVTVALTNGLFGLSEYVWIQGHLLGIRNYGFLLTGCLFILALIAGWGLAEVASGRYDLRDVLLDSLLFAVLAAAGLWLLQGRQGGVLALSLSVAAFAVCAVLWLRSFKDCGVTCGTSLPVIVIFLELVFTTFNHLPTLGVVTARTDQPEAEALAQTREPNLGSSVERLPEYREFEFLGAEYWPYHFEGPAVFKTAFAYSAPYHETPLSPLGLHGLSHLFRVDAYEVLLRENKDPEILRAIFGATRPILELVAMDVVAIGAEGISLVLRDGSGDPLQSLPAAGGEIKAIDYQGERLSVEVQVPDEALLIYRDNIAPGWTVNINGAPAELLVVDRVNKAVALVPGTHAVEFLYRPWVYIATFWIRAIVLIASAAACLVLAVRGNHSNGVRRSEAPR
jgi:hypothetical protein